MNIAICDDEEIYRSAIKRLLRKYMESKCMNASIVLFESGDKLCSSKMLHSLDVLFLDVDMNGLDGIETGKIISKINPSVIIVYISNYIEYSPQSHEVEGTFRYLLKGDLNEKFERCMDEILDKLHLYSKKITLNFLEGRLEVFQHEILYMESQKHKVICYFANPQRGYKVLCKKLDEMEQLINIELFVRNHKSYLTNMYYIKRIDKDIELYNGNRLPIAQRKLSAVKRKYFLYRSNL